MDPDVDGDPVWKSARVTCLNLWNWLSLEQDRKRRTAGSLPDSGVGRAPMCLVYWICKYAVMLLVLCCEGCCRNIESDVSNNC